MQYWIMACAGLGTLGLGLWWSRRAGEKPREGSFLLVGGRWLLRAHLPGPEPTGTLAPEGRLRHSFRNWRSGRMARAFVPEPWASSMRAPSVRLERRATSRQVRVDSAWEMRMYEPRSWVSQLRFQMKVAAVAGMAVVSALFYGRQDLAPEASPASPVKPEAGCPGGVVAQPEMSGRWYLASLTSPTAHPFRTVSAHSNVAPTTPAHVNSLGAGHINNTPAHANVPPGMHTNADAFHTNSFTAHTNTDVRPFPGPL